MVRQAALRQLQAPGIAGDLRAQAQFKEKEALETKGEHGAKGDNLERTENESQDVDMDNNEPQQQTRQSSESDLEIVLEEKVSGE